MDYTINIWYRNKYGMGFLDKIEVKADSERDAKDKAWEIMKKKLVAEVER